MATKPGKRETTHARVLKETARLAAMLARRWGVSQVEVYRYAMELAVEVEDADDKNNGK